MKLLGIDFETTGLRPQDDYIIETGLVVWDTDLHLPIAMDNFFTNHGMVIDASITEINGVHQSFVDEFGVSENESIGRIQRLEYSTKATVAHNGNMFDKPFYSASCDRIGAFFNPKRIWIDTGVDIDFSEEIVTRKLTYLAAEHGFLNPFAHRALFDVLSMMIILDKYNLDEIMYSAQQPSITIQSMVSYDNRDKAKEHRFYWDPSRKMWLKTIKKHKYKPESFPFSTREVNLEYK